MALKHIPEEPKNQTLDEMKIGELVYSLEVKLMKTDMGWFMLEGAASASMKYNDPAEKFDAEAITNNLKGKIPAMSAEDLENLKVNLNGGPFRLIKEFKEVIDIKLAQNYRDYEPEVLKHEKEKVESIIKMQKSIEQLMEMIGQKLKALQTPEKIQKDTQKNTEKQLHLFDPDKNGRS